MQCGFLYSFLNTSSLLEGESALKHLGFHEQNVRGERCLEDQVGAMQQRLHIDYCCYSKELSQASFDEQGQRMKQKNRKKEWYYCWKAVQ